MMISRTLRKVQICLKNGSKILNYFLKKENTEKNFLSR